VFVGRAIHNINLIKYFCVLFQDSQIQSVHKHVCHCQTMKFSALRIQWLNSMISKQDLDHYFFTNFNKYVLILICVQRLLMINTKTLMIISEAILHKTIKKILNTKFVLDCTIFLKNAFKQNFFLLYNIVHLGFCWKV